MERMIFYVLGFVILLVMLAFGVNYYQKAQGSLKETTAVTTINQIVAGTEQLYNGQPNFTGVDNVVLVTAGKIPDNIIADAANGQIMNPWGGTITVASDNAAASAAGGGTPSAFDVDLAGLPQSACMQLATAFSSGNFQGENINGTVFKSVANGGTLVTPGVAAGACTVAGNGNNISFAFN